MKKGIFIRCALLTIICITACYFGGFWGGTIFGISAVTLVTYSIGKLVLEKKQKEEEILNKLIQSIKNDVRHGNL